jgi:RNA polymerase sigma-70 factor (ECF subfamily)
VAAFIAAWERNDVDAVVTLLADDVVWSMPPYAEWYLGREAVRAFIARTPLRAGRRWRAEPATVNGQSGISFSVWREDVGAFLTHGLSLLTFEPGGRITAFTTFLDPAVVPTS